MARGRQKQRESTSLAGVAGDGIALQRVRTAYEQIADQLRMLIRAGRLQPGRRLPTEVALSRDFGVSRTTIREALRLLVAEGLIRTSKGPTGGSYVTRPDMANISTYLETNIGLLAQTADVTLDELLEARAQLEIPGARFAAQRRTDVDLEIMGRATSAQARSFDRETEFIHNRNFHMAVMAASANKILTLAAGPIFLVLHARLVRSPLEPDFHETNAQHHREIGDAIRAGDGDRAADLMASHLDYLRPQYERAWNWPPPGAQ